MGTQVARFDSKKSHYQIRFQHPIKSDTVDKSLRYLYIAFSPSGA